MTTPGTYKNCLFPCLYRISAGFAFLLFTLIFLSSCETDLAEVDRLASIQEEEPFDISYGVTVVYSDSAKVKAKMTAPEMRHYNVEEPYYEFQKGVLIIFYDEEGKETQRITSEYAIQKEVQGLTEFRRNVVITLQNGSVIKTEELIHDEKENIFYNHVPISMYSNDGQNDFQGSSFRSDGNFENIDVENSTFLYHVEEGRIPAF